MTLPGSTKTLKDVLKGQVKGGKEMYVQSTVRQMLTPDEQQALRLNANDPLTPADRDRLNRALAASSHAQDKVRAWTPTEIWQQITPITNFIADEANIYSIKPLLMIDAAHMDFATMADAVTWVGIGGGVQFTVVVARLEAGYLLGRPPFAHRPARQFRDAPGFSQPVLEVANIASDRRGFRSL